MNPNDKVIVEYDKKTEEGRIISIDDEIALVELKDNNYFRKSFSYLVKESPVPVFQIKQPEDVRTIIVSKNKVKLK